MERVLLKKVKYNGLFTYNHIAYCKCEFVRKYNKYKCFSIVLGEYKYLSGDVLVHPLNN